MFAINQVRESEDSVARFQSAEEFDAPLRESEHFICVPSLGSIKSGWVLITPRRPLLNMAHLNAVERREFRDFFQIIRDDLESSFGEICAFEHGAQEIGSATGCGVDQAHLHLVPISFEALFRQTASRAEWITHSFSLPFDLDTSAREYLWLANSSRSYIAHPKSPVSQFFRRAVADGVGLSSQWDYRTHPFHENIAVTRRVLSNAVAPPQTRAA